MHLKYAEMLAIVVHENMKLGDNTPEKLSLVNTKFPTKKLVNCSPYFTALQDINNFGTLRSYKMTVNLDNLN